MAYNINLWKRVVGFVDVNTQLDKEKLALCCWREKGKRSFKFINGFFVEPALSVIIFASPILAVRCKRQVRKGAKKSWKTNVKADL